MEQKILIHNGRIYLLTEATKDSIIEQAARGELLKMYCGDGYPESCKVLSAQIDDPSNEGRIYTVEI